MISGGEVELVLAAKDLMSPTLVTAALQVKNLETQMKSMGTMSVEQIMELNTRLGAAMENFARLAEMNKGTIQQAFGRLAAEQSAIASSGASLSSSLAAQATTTTAAATATNALANASASAAVAVKGQKAATDEATASMGMMESLTIRMIERLAILFLIRETFSFLKGIIDANEALRALSDTTDISVEHLSKLFTAAEDGGVKTDKFSTAVDTLNKRLAEMKPATNEALAQLGFSFQNIFDMKPDDRIDNIVKAIAALPDKMDQVKVATALFGTDGIMPLIKHFDDLMNKAKDSNNAISQNTSDTLHLVKQSWGLFFTDLTGIIEKGWADAINAAGKAFQGNLFMNPPTPSGLITGGDFPTLQTNLLPGGSIHPPGENPNARAQQDATDKGWQHIAMLWKQLEADKAITDDEREKFSQLEQLNQLTEAEASLTDINIEHFRIMMKERTEGAAQDRRDAAEKAKSLREWDSMVMASFEREIAAMRAVQAARQGAYAPSEQVNQLGQLLQAEEQLTRQTYFRLSFERDNDKERMRLIEEMGKRRIDIENQIMAIEKGITKEINEQNINELAAAQRNAQRIGMSIQTNSNLNPITIDQANNPWVLLDHDMRQLDVDTRAGIDTTQRRKEIEDNFVVAMGGFLQTFSEGDHVMTGLAEAAAAAKKRLDDLAKPPPDTDPSLITPWSKMVPKPITISEIGVDQFMKAMPQPIGPVNVNVSGVLDPITIKTLAEEVGKVILKGSSRQLPAR